MRLILASTSPARLMLLRSTGIEPALVAPGVDEEAAVAEAAARQGRPLDAVQTVSMLARAKAEAVAALLIGDGVREGLVLGGDSAFELGGAVYGKPHAPEVARERWRSMRGATGMLHSGHWLIDLATGRAAGGAADAVVRFAADLDDTEIDAYIATGEPLKVAGAFTLDGRAQAFIDGIEGDPSTVVGLSIPVLRSLVRELGHEWPSLWNR